MQSQLIRSGEFNVVGCCEYESIVGFLANEIHVWQGPGAA